MQAAMIIGFSSNVAAGFRGSLWIQRPGEGSLQGFGKTEGIGLALSPVVRTPSGLLLRRFLVQGGLVQVSDPSKEP